MPRTSRRALRSSARKPGPLAVVSLRVTLDTWARCEWAALAKGVTRNEFVRNTLDDATRDAKPPELRSFRGVGSAREQARWRDVAARYGFSDDEFLRKAANIVVKELSAQLEQVDHEQAVR